MKKILIVSNFFHPEITPRALRTYELAKEFGRRGCKVAVVVPNKELFHRNPVKLPGVEVIYGDGPVIPESFVPARKKVRKFVPKWLETVILYFYNHEYFAKYDKGIERRLGSLSGNFDLLISLSYPVAVHRAVMKAFRRNTKLTAEFKIAEFSDPPLRNENSGGYFPVYNLFFKKAAKFFDRFVIPVSNAIPCYSRYKPASEIAVIPQGFNNSEVRIRVYIPPAVPTFAFAGRFYRNTRDPEPLFRHLASLKRDFVFNMFLIDRDEYFDRMIEEYQSRMQGRLIVRDPLPRGELIYELSGMDFLVNHNFNYSTATPSKLIDYALADRPVYSFSSDRFDRASFDRFIDGDYSAAEQMPPVELYDIRNIVTSFEDLPHGGR